MIDEFDEVMRSQEQRKRMRLKERKENVMILKINIMHNR